MTQFSISPTVTVVERDETVSVPNIVTDRVGLAGNFQWGPCFERKQVTNESELVSWYGIPTNTNYDTWFNVAEYFRYGNNAWIVRAVDPATAKNAGLAVSNDAYGTAVLPIGTNPYIPNSSSIPTITFTANQKLKIVARYPGTYGNTKIKIALATADDFATANIESSVTFKSKFDYAPQSNAYDYYDQLAIAVMVQNNLDSNWQIVEKWVVDLDPTAKDSYGRSNYIENVINNRSEWIYAFDNTTIVESPNSFEATLLAGGVDGAPSASDVQDGYDLFDNPEEFDINRLIDAGNTDVATQQHILAIAEERMDAFGILCVPKDELLDVDISTAVSNAVTYASTALNTITSYGAIYANAKYVYDKYNDTYRWITMSGDVAGVYAVTADKSDVWYPPAGDTAPLRNVSKLAINPKKAYRDTLMAANVNPIVARPGQGAQVYGQRTLLNYQSAFSDINVRLLFIVLEKAIATAAEHNLFKINDYYQQNLFKLMTEPYLRRVQGGRGVRSYQVVCDSTTNTPSVVSAGGFVANIVVEPARGIHQVTLNFIATQTGVSFTETVTPL